MDAETLLLPLIFPLMLFGAAVFLARRVRWAAIVLFALGTVVSIPLGCGVLLTIRCTPFVSPDGRYVATISELNGGATDRFWTSVEVRSRWSLRSRTVFFSNYAPNSIWIGWPSESRLVIRYPQDRVDDLRECSSPISGVEVICEPLDNGPAGSPPREARLPECCRTITGRVMPRGPQ